MTPVLFSPDRPTGTETTVADRRFMAAAIRYAMRNVGRTATNPSVATLVVRDDGDGPRLVGRGLTAIGGRPHAEPVALAEAGPLAKGATAYVTLEPCAHHGRTPPCADALVAAGIARVVSAAADPDSRVDGRGHAVLETAGVTVIRRVMAEEAAETISGYLSRHRRQRPEVTLKLALSADGMLGVGGRGQVKITGSMTNAQTHLTRTRHDAIIVGVGTVIEDDPRLDCRLPGLGDRSPSRIVLDPRLRTTSERTVVRTARATPTLIATCADSDASRRSALAAAGAGFIACEVDPETGRIALPELLEDLGARGMSSVLVEGGAHTARAFLDEDLVDRLLLLRGEVVIGADGIASPIDIDMARARFRPVREYRFGADHWFEFARRED